MLFEEFSVTFTKGLTAVSLKHCAHYPIFRMDGGGHKLAGPVWST